MLKISADDSATAKGKERSMGDDDLGMSTLSMSKSAPAAMTPTPVPGPPPYPLTLDTHGEKVEGEEGWVEEVTELDYEMITVKIADLGNG